MYMLMSRYQKTGRKFSIKTANGSFEDVAYFKYLRTTVADKSNMDEEIKSRLNSGNICYHSVHSLLSSRLFFRIVKANICKTIILLVVLYGYENLSLT
jgi:hypothetical protein